MTNKEINELARWTAKKIRGEIQDDGGTLDAAGEDIIREFIQACMVKWQNREKITRESLSQLGKEIFMRRHNETMSGQDAFGSMMVFAAKFPEFVEYNQSEREKEAAQISATLPAVKV